MKGGPLKDLRKAIQRCHDVLLIESWFRDFLQGKNLEYDYYRNENDFKLMAAAKVLIKPMSAPPICAETYLAWY